MIDILFLAIIAAFIVFKLKGTLGKDSGIDPRTLGRPKDRQADANVIPMRQIQAPVPRDPDLSSYDNVQVAKGLAAIKTLDPQFSIVEFLGGAKTAFEWILSAFSKGEKQKLAPLLADDVFEQFSRAIDEYKHKNQQRETTLVSIVSQDITDVRITETTAQITLNIISEQIHLVRDMDKKIIEGDPSDVQKVEDEWVFERDLASKNPNWKIIAT